MHCLVKNSSRKLAVRLSEQRKTWSESALCWIQNNDKRCVEEVSASPGMWTDAILLQKSALCSSVQHKNIEISFHAVPYSSGHCLPLINQSFMVDKQASSILSAPLFCCRPVTTALGGPELGLPYFHLGFVKWKSPSDYLGAIWWDMCRAWRKSNCSNNGLDSLDAWHQSEKGCTFLLAQVGKMKKKPPSLIIRGVDKNMIQKRSALTRCKQHAQPYRRALSRPPFAACSFPVICSNPFCASAGEHSMQCSMEHAKIQTTEMASGERHLCSEDILKPQRQEQPL